MSSRWNPSFLDLCFEIKNDPSSLVGCVPPLQPGHLSPRDPPSLEDIVGNGVSILRKGPEAPLLPQGQMQGSLSFLPYQPDWVGVGLIGK